MAAIIQMLTQVKEFIALICFFTAGALWVNSSFASKCYVEANLKAFKALSTQQVIGNEVNRLGAEITIYQSLIDQIDSLESRDALKSKIKELESDRNKQIIAQMGGSSIETVKSSYEKCTVF